MKNSLIVALIVLVAAGAFYFYSKDQVRVIPNYSAIDSWISYNDTQFLDFKYPKDFKIVKDQDPSQLQLSIYPQPQPIEFGPVLSLTVYNNSEADLLNDIKNRYKKLFVSSEQVNINNRDWIHAVIINDYFEDVVHEHYFTPYKKGGYLEVVYSKGPYASDFLKIISTLSGF